jgi:two-component system alkaline phosphatase synthesis response regulator PhoP
MNQRVLVVEDDRDIAQLVELHLKDLGCRCDIARDGEKGLEKALKNEYELIILDLMLPGSTGWRSAKKSDRRRTTPPFSC